MKLYYAIVNARFVNAHTAVAVTLLQWIQFSKYIVM